MVCIQLSQPSQQDSKEIRLRAYRRRRKQLSIRPLKIFCAKNVRPKIEIESRSIKFQQRLHVMTRWPLHELGKSEGRRFNVPAST